MHSVLPQGAPPHVLVCGKHESKLLPVFSTTLNLNPNVNSMLFSCSLRAQASSPLGVCSTNTTPLVLSFFILAPSGSTASYLLFFVPCSSLDPPLPRYILPEFPPSSLLSGCSPFSVFLSLYHAVFPNSFFLFLPWLLSSEVL